MVNIYSLLALFITFANCCTKQFVGFILAILLILTFRKLLLVFNKETIFFMIMHAATNLAILLRVSSHHSTRILKRHIDSLFFQ